MEGMNNCNSSSLVLHSRHDHKIQDNTLLLPIEDKDEN